MKIPHATIHLSELGYPDQYTITLPRSVTPGWLKGIGAKGPETPAQAARRNRGSNIAMFALASDWTLEDDAGVRMPLFANVHGETVPEGAKVADLIAELLALRAIAGSSEAAGVSREELRAKVQAERDYNARVVLYDQVPLDIINFVADRVLNPTVPERVADF